MTPRRQNRLSRGARRLAVWGLLLASAVGALGEEAKLDLQAWFRWLQNGPRIRRLVARITEANLGTRYLLLVLDGDNYTVKLAPSEKLLQARVLTAEIDAVGRCGDEFWAVSGRIPPLQSLHFVRDQDLNSKQSNFVSLAQVFNYGTAWNGFAFLYLGVPLQIDPRRGQRDLRLTEDGFEIRGGYGGSHFTNRVVMEHIDHREGRLISRLARTVIGTDGLGLPVNGNFVTEVELESGSFIPLRYNSYAVDKTRPRLLLTVERLSLELSDSPLPLRLFRPELYVLEGFPMAMRLEGDHVLMVPTHDRSWRKVVLFGHVLPYRVVKWAVIALIAAVTVAAGVVVRNHHRIHNK